MKVIELFERAKYYDGSPLESGGTSIRAKGNIHAPGIDYMIDVGFFNNAKTVLDYGAGKYARNANFLRSVGYKVYAYDPFNGVAGADGWNETSTTLPKSKFDVGFTSYVLNVVPQHIEQSIVSEVESKCKNSFHITRNLDVRDTLRRAILNPKSKVLLDFIANHFAENDDMERILLAQKEGDWKPIDDIINELCRFGYATSQGFQRIPYLEGYGFNLTRGVSGFKIYSK